jgi:hypothetical protein
MNDRVLAESVFTIYQAARKMNELLRDGKIRELELLLGTVNNASLKGGYRCLDIAYQKQPETEGAGT